jgi:thioredoxin 1
MPTTTTSPKTQQTAKSCTRSSTNAWLAQNGSESQSSNGALGSTREKSPILLSTIVVPVTVVVAVHLFLRWNTVHKHRDLEQMVVDVTESNQSVLRKGIVVVDFFAPWCGPCKRLTPAFERLSLAFQDTGIVFAKVNGDDHEDLMEEFHVNAYPTVMLLKNGKVVKSVEGCDEGELDEIVQKAKSLV